MRWPNVVTLTVSYLKAKTGVRTVTTLPDDLVAKLPLHRVIRGPGSDDKITDSVLVDVETFTLRNDSVPNSQDAMWDAAEDARQAMHDLAGAVVNGALVDTVNTATAPTYLDYGNPQVWRAVASYRLELRKR